MLLLLAGSGLLGAFSVLLSSVAAAVFLETFGAGALPFLYVGSAVLVASAGVIYARLESRVPVRLLLPGTLVLLLLGVLVTRGALALQEGGLAGTAVEAGGFPWPAVLLAGFGELAASFVPLTFWAVAQRLFDVRQAKRLFGPVGAGEVAATAVGGFSAPVIVALIGTANLLWLCAAGLTGLLLVFLVIMRSFPAKYAAEQRTAEEERLNLSKGSRLKLNEPYVVLMLLFAVLATVTYYFVATAFLVQARAEFPTQDALAGFLGVFTGVLSVVSFAGRSLVAGRVMARFGVRTSLILTPLAVAITAALVVGTGLIPRAVEAIGMAELAPLAGVAAFMFLANCVSRVCMETTWDSMYKPAFLVLYQPLPARNRLWLQTVVEGIAAPLAQGLTGLCLLAYRIFLGYDPVGLSGAALVLASGWLVVGSLVGRRYVAELLSAVRRRSLDMGSVSRQAGTDPAALQVLEGRLRDGRPDEVIYCLTMLDQASYARIDQILIEQTAHEVPSVREHALRALARRRVVTAVPRITRILAEDQVPSVRAAALRALATIDQQSAIPHLEAAVDQAETEVRLAGLIGLLDCQGARETAARARLRQLAVSHEELDRILAAYALGEARERELHYLVGRLLRDNSTEVRRAALRAAGQMDLPSLWPLVVQRLVVPDTARAAATALIRAGATAMPFLVAAFLTPSTPRALRLTIVRLCGRIRDRDAIELLLKALEYPDAELRRQALRALDACAYRATGKLAERIPELIAREVEAAAWISAAQRDLQTTERPDYIQNTFATEIDFARQRALLLLSMVYDAGAITRCASLILGGNAERRAYALEILDNLVPHAIKTTLFPLLDDLSTEARLAALQHAFPQTAQTRLSDEARLQALIERGVMWCHPWSVACWAYLAGLLGWQSCRGALEGASRNLTPLVTETSEWALKALDDRSLVARSASNTTATLTTGATA